MSYPQWNAPARSGRVSEVGPVTVIGLVLVVLWSLYQYVCVAIALIQGRPVVAGFHHHGGIVDLLVFVFAITAPPALAVLALARRTRKMAIVTAVWLGVMAVGQILAKLLLYGWAAYWVNMLTTLRLGYLGLGLPHLGYLVVELVIFTVLIGLIVAGVVGRGGQQTAAGGFAPAAAVAPGPYAQWGARVGAALLDGLPAGLLGLVGALALSGTMNTPTHRNPSFGPSGGGIAVMILCYAGSFAYMIWNVGFRQGKTGQTWGKRALGIAVIGEQTGAPLGVGLSIGRQFAQIVNALPCYIGFLFPLWDAKAQTFADKMIGSIVVAAQPGSTRQVPLPPNQPATPTQEHQQRMAEMRAELDLLRQLNAERDKHRD